MPSVSRWCPRCANAAAARTADPPGRLDGRPYILALGAKEPRKNLPRLVDAFGLLHRKQPDLALVLLGPEGPDQHHIDAAIARQPREAADQILMIDYVTDDDRNAILHGAAALAYPSLDEGFGFSALEAMAAGVPVVAADAGSLPEVCGDAAPRQPPQPRRHGRRAGEDRHG